MDYPGQCCGKYECQREPNCTEVHDTDNFWLTNCQRCKCYAGQRICHQSCDEAMIGKKPTGGMCHVKNLNKFFEHGDSWKDGCYECECVNGEPKCVITFCKSVSCPTHRQVMLKDSCCPVCWPKGYPMPHETEDEYDEDDKVDSGHHYDDEDGVEPLPEYNEHIDIDLKPAEDINTTAATNVNSTSNNATVITTVSNITTPLPSKPTTTTTTTTAATTTTTTTTSSTAKPAEIIIATTAASTLNKLACNEIASSTPSTATTAAPCQARAEAPATYVYPPVVELMNYSSHNNILYVIIGCLSVLVLVLGAWSIQLRAKQRSYRPVSNIDDNFNRLSSNIKKMNDYV